jgi:hypothetical protein
VLRTLAISVPQQAQCRRGLSITPPLPAFFQRRAPDVLQLVRYSV